MVRRKTDGGSPAGLPPSPDEGPGSAVLPNPKQSTAVLPDVFAVGIPDGGLTGRGMTQTSTGFAGSNDPNTMGSEGNPGQVRGGPGTIPNPNNVNRGYSEVTDGNVPAVSGDVSANRFRHNIDPGALVLGPAEDDLDEPVVPKFGVGGTGD